MTNKPLLSKSVMQKERFDSSVAHSLLAGHIYSPPQLALKVTINKELLRDLVETKLMRDQIINLTLNALPKLIQELERQRVILMDEIEYERRAQERFGAFLWPFVFRNHVSQCQELQSDVLAHELLLEKLRQRTVIKEELYKRVLQRVYGAAESQIALWTRNQSLVRYLRVALSKPYTMDRLVPSGTPHYQRNHKEKPLPKKQLKHSKR
jgi:hypothetical protein